MAIKALSKSSMECISYPQMDTLVYLSLPGSCLILGILNWCGAISSSAITNWDLKKTFFYLYIKICFMHVYKKIYHVDKIEKLN